MLINTTIRSRGDGAGRAAVNDNTIATADGRRSAACAQNAFGSQIVAAMCCSGWAAVV